MGSWKNHIKTIAPKPTYSSLRRHMSIYIYIQNHGGLHVEIAIGSRRGFVGCKRCEQTEWTKVGFLGTYIYLYNIYIVRLHHRLTRKLLSVPTSAHRHYPRQHRLRRLAYNPWYTRGSAIYIYIYIYCRWRT